MPELGNPANFVKSLLVRAKFTNLFTFSCSALECAEPIVVTAGGFVRDVRMTEEERGAVTVCVRVVRNVEMDARSVAEACVKCWPGFNDLATTHPDYAATWYQPHNGALKPTDVTAGSTKAAWWHGLGCNHVFDMPVYQRVAAKLAYCPYCTGRRVPERPITG